MGCLQALGKIRHICKFSDHQGQRGFTLIELMVVLVVGSLILVAATKLLAIQFKGKQQALAKERLKRVQVALADYVLDDADAADETVGSFGDTGEDAIRYPCPASLRTPPDAPGFGEEVCPDDLGLDTNGNRIFTDDGPLPLGELMDGSGNPSGIFVAEDTSGKQVLVGAVPTATLGISNDFMLDQRNNRLTYAVTLNQVGIGALKLNGPGSGVDKGAIKIIREDGTQITDHAKFALINHGQDGAGAFTADGVPAKKACRVTTQGDAQNCSYAAATDITFRKQDVYNTKLNSNSYYDDTVAFSLFSDEDNEGWWKSANDAASDITIKNPGNVGIGTSTPAAKLDVAGEIRTSRNPLQYLEAVDNDALGAFIRGHSAEFNKKPLYIDNLHDGSGGALGELAIELRTGDESAPDVRMHISENGNTGIGTTDPKAKLDVNGAVKIGTAAPADCNANTIGAMRYKSGDDEMQYCAADDGSGASPAVPGWKSLGGGGLAFGDPESKSVGVPYTATTDGFVIGWVQAAGGSTRIVASMTDPVSGDTFTAQNGGTDPAASVTLAVPKGYQWRVDCTFGDCSYRYATWVPVIPSDGSGGGSTGPAPPAAACASDEVLVFDGTGYQCTPLPSGALAGFCRLTYNQGGSAIGGLALSPATRTGTYGSYGCSCSAGWTSVVLGYETVISGNPNNSATVPVTYACYKN